MTARELQLLVELRARVENEDWFGTCSSSEEADKLEAEHIRMLERIDEVLQHHGSAPT